jgi:formyltetrahydrofolate deformylase
MTAHNKNESAILLVHCDDQPGLVASVTRFIQQYKGNILDLDQHTAREDGKFFMRVAWDLEKFTLARDSIGATFAREVAELLRMEWQLSFPEQKQRMAIFVSQKFHCLYDLLSRYKSGEWEVEIPLIITNHTDAEAIAWQFDIDCHVLPITSENKKAQEARELELLQQYRIDFLVLARYMQILSEEFINEYPNRIINIHHSFLPAFPGARPYHSAYERGVKIIGATSHYVTGELDAGPIIAQDVVHVSHRDSIDDLVRRGRDLEKLVLSRAIWLHMQRKILVYDNRTIIFG